MQQAQAVADRSFLKAMTDLYTTPTDAFRSLLARPRVVPPLVLLICLALAFAALWVSKVDSEAFMREQLEQSPRAVDLTNEQKAAVIEQQSKYIPLMAWASAVAIGPAMWLATAAVYLMVFRFMLGADLQFKQSLAVVLWSFLAVDLVQTPLLALVLLVKGDWNVDPNTALQANLTLFLDRGTTPAWLYALVGSLDLFSFWLLYLLAAGYGLASRRTLSRALPGVLGPWLLYLLLQIGWAALF